MLRACAITAVVFGLLACGKGDRDKPAPTPAPELTGPMPIRFGDCGATSLAWVSGPRPLPFTPDEAKGIVAVKPPAPRADEELTDTDAFAGLLGSEDAIGALDGPDVYRGRLASEEDPTQRTVPQDTIGTATYGTTGTGSGMGYAPVKPTGTSMPATTIGEPIVQGDLDKALVRRFVQRNRQKLEYCYEKELLAKQWIGGTVQTQFFIGPEGLVTTSSATGVDPEVAACVASVVKAIEFPKPKGGGAAQVNQPFTYQPPGTTPYPRPPAPPLPTVPDSVADATAVPPRALLRPASWPPVAAESYAPGANHPLRAEEAALAACFRKGKAPYGVAVVELGYDTAGAVTAASVHGIGEASVRDCVVTVAKRAKRPRVTSERCSLAFGEMPGNELPTIAVTAEAIVYRGQSYKLDDDERASEPLVTVLAGELAPILDENGPVVSVRDPRVVHPGVDAPMRIVNAAIASVIRGGDDVLLAHGPDKKLFAPTATLPGVPVPLGTGGRWFPIKARPSATGTLPTDGNPQLSILVEKHRVMIGVSRTNDFQETAWAEVATELLPRVRRHKEDAFFADRVDVEIAGAGDADFGQLLQVIDIAARAGFTDWRFAMPEDLSARPRW